jgi:hypothetical protein
MDFRRAALERLARTKNNPTGEDFSFEGNEEATHRGQGPNPVQTPQTMGELLGSNPRPLDPRSLLGMFSRGANVYPGGQQSAHRGPNINMGRPRNDGTRQDFRQVAARRLGR